jgi:2-iminobutanoate/2-iminopropanoate deaminase
LQAKISNNLIRQQIVFHQFSSGVPTPIGHYCHAAELPNGIVALSGIKAWKAGAGTHIDGNVQEQARLIFRHVEALLAALQLKRQNIFKISVHLESVQDYEVFNSCYSEWLDSHKPARTVLAGYSLRGGAKLELVVEAYRAAT